MVTGCEKRDLQWYRKWKNPPKACHNFSDTWKANLIQALFPSHSVTHWMNLHKVKYMTIAENMQLNKTAGSRVSKSAQGADSRTLHNEDKSKKRQHGTIPTLIYPPQKLRSNNGSSSQVHANDWNDDEGLLLLLSMHGRPLGNKKHQTSASQHSLKISSSTVHHPQTWAISMPHLFVTEWETAISGVWHQSRQNTCL